MQYKNSYCQKATRLCFFLMVMISVSCNIQKDNKISDSAKAKTDLQFFDSGSFDRKLASELKGGPPAITIGFPASVNINKIPERLDKWFYMLEKYNGTVNLEPDSEYAERGLIAEAIGLVIGTYDYVKEKITYGPIQNYNATVYYEQGSGKITKVIFNHRPLEPENSKIQ